MWCILYNPDQLRLGLQGRTSFFVLFFSPKPETAKNSGLTRKKSSSVSFSLDGRRTQRTRGQVLDADDNKGYRHYSEVQDFQKFQKSFSAPPHQNRWTRLSARGLQATSDKKLFGFQFWSRRVRPSRQSGLKWPTSKEQYVISVARLLV